MGWFEAIVLGLVQGLTEFLPISSSAHLRIVGELAGWDDPGAAFTAVSQIGTVGTTSKSEPRLLLARPVRMAANWSALCSGEKKIASHPSAISPVSSRFLGPTAAR